MKHFWMLYLLAPFFADGQALFTKVTDPSNPVVTFANTAATYKGLAWIDLNDDNLPDLFVSQSFLFQNKGNGQFVRLPDVAGAGGGQGAAGCSWGDIDNDSDQDCITASLVSGLHLNNGDQTFSLETSKLPGFAGYSAWDCAMADVDNNGRLDLLFVHANGFHSSGPFFCRLFLQNTDGTFSSVTGYEFTNQLKPYTIPIWSDYDLDGDMDLFIGAGPAGTLGPDFCYKNMFKETGSFALQRLTIPPFNTLQDGQTYNFPDFDNDGDLDICLTNYAGGSNRFWRNDNGTYVPLNTPFTTLNKHLANVWGDVDNDGDLDVLISWDASALIRLFLNNGDGSFSSGKIAGNTASNSSGIALADYDNDGDLDFYSNGALESRSLFRNDSLASNRNWAFFKLEGVQSNRSAIGAVIRLKVNIGGQSVWQIRQVLAHNSFQSQSEFRQHFGLNDATAIDSVEVRWPSGLVEKFANLAVNNFYKIIEGQGINILTATIDAREDSSLRIFPNPFTQSFRLEFSDEQSQISTVQLFNTNGQLISISASPEIGIWQLDLKNNVPAGQYFVRVQLEHGEVLTKKIIKQ